MGGTLYHWLKSSGLTALSSLLSLGRGPGSRMSVSKDGIRASFYVRKGSADVITVLETWLLGEYSRPELRPGSVVFDIGANIGTFSVYAAKRVGRTGRVFAYEPDPENYELLLKNLRLNEARNVVPVRKAVWGRKGRIEFCSCSHGSISSAVGGGIGKRIAVEATTLPDELRARRIGKIDLLKVDIEGGEYELFESFPPGFLEKRVSKIILEYHNDRVKGKSGRTLEKLLGRRGFRVRRSRAVSGKAASSPKEHLVNLTARCLSYLGRCGMISAENRKG